MDLDYIKEVLYDMVISGGYKKGGSWGGVECAAHVPYHVHVYESVTWIVLMLGLFFYFDFSGKVRELEKVITAKMATRKYAHLPFFRVLDLVLCTMAFGMWLTVLYYKINLHSLINLLQPCHLVVLAQGFALLYDNSTGLLIALLSLHMVSGSGAAFLFPDTSGLDQPYEVEEFWIQHTFVQVVPLYLLLRNNGLGAEVADLKIISFGNWILVFMHWTLFEVVDYTFQVNVNFFLCPATAMGEAFKTMVPAVLMLPSYRTFLMWFFPVTSTPVCYLYIFAAKLIHYLSVLLYRSIWVGGEDAEHKRHGCGRENGERKKQQ